MPDTIKITSDQRNALYEQVRTHLSGLSDVFTAMERNSDFATAKRLGNEFAEDMRLLRTSAGTRTTAPARSS